MCTTCHSERREGGVGHVCVRVLRVCLRGGFCCAVYGWGRVEQAAEAVMCTTCHSECVFREVACCCDENAPCFVHPPPLCHVVRSAIMGSEPCSPH
jgi:hypothetical protein